MRDNSIAETSIEILILTLFSLVHPLDSGRLCRSMSLHLKKETKIRRVTSTGVALKPLSPKGMLFADLHLGQNAKCLCLTGGKASPDLDLHESRSAKVKESVSVDLRLLRCSLSIWRHMLCTVIRRLHIVHRFLGLNWIILTDRPFRSINNVDVFR